MITTGKRYNTDTEAAVAAYHLGPEWSAVKTTYACNPWMVQRTARVGDYLNRIGYSDVHPYQIVRLSASGKTAYIRAVTVEKDPNWKPEIIPGGFAGHCTNNGSQTWLYGDLQGPEIAVRLNKKGKWVKGHTRYKLAEKPHHHYDYNF